MTYHSKDSSPEIDCGTCYGFVNDTIKNRSASIWSHIEVSIDTILKHKPDYYRDANNNVIPFHWHLWAEAILHKNISSSYCQIKTLNDIKPDDIITYIDVHYNPDVRSRNSQQSSGTHIAIIKKVKYCHDDSIELKIMDVSKRRKNRKILGSTQGIYKKPGPTLGYSKFIITETSKQIDTYQPKLTCYFKGCSVQKNYILSIFHLKD